ncbi:hypothetical protein D041_3925A, partial [Vibrio parahaemolyticus EKP-008]
MNRETNTAHS